MVRAVSVLVVASALLFAHRAHACSGPSCTESRAAPAASGTIPANAPAIVFVEGRAPYWDPLAKAGPPTLKTLSGATIPTTRDGELLRPAAPLPVGVVSLEWDEVCRPPSDAGAVPRAIQFNVTEATPLPTTLGAVTFTYARQKVTIRTYAGSCTDQIDAAVARIDISLDTTLAKFRDVVSIKTSVDGASWGWTSWGKSAIPTGMDYGSRRPDLVFAACEPSPSGTTDRGVAEGKHKVEVRAEVAGAGPIPAASFEIDLRCGGAPDGGSVTPDATPAEPDTAVADAAPRDDDDTVTSGYGCGVAPRAGITPFAGAFALTMLAIRRRRRPLDTPRGDR